ncbi:hypothetical protein [Streptomyces sp. NPDC005181]|uniref:hypothetical protein n=1 Tax=Streptomyces sp. NPDC005181 TaxID=3156869 RepID=UPI0033A34D28
MSNQPPRSTSAPPKFNRDQVVATISALAVTCDRANDTGQLAPALDKLCALVTTDPDCLRELVLATVGRDEAAWSATAHPQQVGPQLLQGLIEQREAGHRADVRAPSRQYSRRSIAPGRELPSVGGSAGGPECGGR